ncbi:neutral zinc metallopeptidase [Nonomuraea roseoviolacea]|uniref:Metalloprotease n=1 Tax=Nonomuraea roseoviolacea subsp. carminata TaxID=160689 RepID=A0ABT1K7W2_9ACTN|nr:neutral zinc metallopeptidase [Nonomuraea roseoviolacea]MCP2349521.1 putative metalloprotease [Nonomuraea roseoviolacea subsp. carminata]
MTAATAAVAALPMTFSMTGTAVAEAPVKGAELTAHPLYDKGALPTVKCKERQVRARDLASVRAYVTGIVGCLDATWEQHLTAAGLPFRKVRVKHYGHIPKKYCGMEIGSDESMAYYCDRTDTIAFQIGKDWAANPYDLWLADMTAGMYGYHVQNVIGIRAATDKEPYRNKTHWREVMRRESLQTACLATAWLKSVWPLDRRTRRDWDDLLALVQGDRRGEPRYFGTTGTIKRWMRRGYAAADPGACNTWAAPSSQVS